MAKQAEYAVDSVTDIISNELSRPTNEIDMNVFLGCLERNPEECYNAFSKSYMYRELFGNLFGENIDFIERLYHYCLSYSLKITPIKEYNDRYGYHASQNLLGKQNLINIVYISCYKSFDCMDIFIKLLKKYNFPFDIYRMVENITLRGSLDFD